jgi:hypothetical protein
MVSRTVCVVGLGAVLCGMPRPVLADPPALWTQMKTACTASGGRPASENYNEWVAAGGCICPGSTRGSGATCAPTASSKGASVALPQLATQVGFALGQAIRQQGEADEAAREAQAEHDKQEFAKWQLADEQRKEASRARLLSSMKGLNPHATVVSLKDPGLADAEHPARGHRIVDCEHARTVIDRMSAGLGVQRDALDRTWNELQSAWTDHKAITEEQRTFVLDKAYDAAMDVISDFEMVSAGLRNLQAAGVSFETRQQLLDALATFHTAQERLIAGKKAFLAGKSFGEDLPNIADGIRANAEKVRALLDNSGVLGKLGQNATKYAFGPSWAAAYKASLLACDFGVLTAKAYYNDKEIAEIKAAYDTLTSQLHAAEDKILEARRDLQEGTCQQQVPQSNSDSLASPPAGSPLPPQ